MKLWSVFAALVFASSVFAAVPAPRPLVLKAAAFQHYAEGFNRDDEELYRQHIPNAGAWDWLQRNVPLFECSDQEIEQTFFFRWWTYRKHLRQTPEGFVVTEFLPNVPWAGKFNTISCPAGHHFYEGRWLADPQFLQDYNHSTFCDLVISGLVGLRARSDDTVEVNPLAPESWDYFCLDQVRYHERWLTILWDKTGTRYGRGKGLRVFADGKEIAAAASLQRVTAALSPNPATEPRGQSTAGWKKFAGNPVMGGQYGTCFDIAVLKEEATYRMWLSWRPKKSLAIVESQDGTRWSEPPQIVLGPRKETGWEDDINRPVVVKRADGYHLWYTGQARGHP